MNDLDGFVVDPSTGRLVDPEIKSRYAQWKWDGVLSQVEQEDHPTASELADMVRRYGVPAAALQYVAGRLDGSIGPKRGRPRKDRLGRWTRAASLTFAVLGCEAAFRIQRLPKPKDRAINIVAERKGISPARLRDILKRDLRDAPHLRSLSRCGAEMKAWVRELRANGTVHLDRNAGLVRLPDRHTMDPDVQRYYQERDRRRPARK